MCRAYVEHGMHKLPQPVKLGPGARSSATRRRRRGLPPVHPARSRGARLGRPQPRRRADPAAGRADRARGRRQPRGAAIEPRQRPRRAPTTSRSCAPTCAGTRVSSRTDVRDRLEANPLRAFDADHEGTRAVTARGRGCSTASTRRTRSTSPKCAPCSTRRGSPTRSTRRSCAGSTTTRARCSSSSRTGSGRRAALGGGGRYDRLVEELGGPPTPGVGWAAGVERIELAPRPRASTGHRACTWRSPGAMARGVRPRPAPARAGHARRDRAGRALAEGSAQAGRPHRRARDGHPRRRHRGQGHADRRAAGGPVATAATPPSERWGSWRRRLEGRRGRTAIATTGRGTSAPPRSASGRAWPAGFIAAATTAA